MVSKHDTKLSVSAQNTQTTKNTKNYQKIAKNTQLTITPIINNTKKHTNTTHPIAKSKTSYSIAIIGIIELLFVVLEFLEFKLLIVAIGEVLAIT